MTSSISFRIKEDGTLERAIHVAGTADGIALLSAMFATSKDLYKQLRSMGLPAELLQELIHHVGGEMNRIFEEQETQTFEK